MCVMKAQEVGSGARFCKCVSSCQPKFEVDLGLWPQILHYLLDMPQIELQSRTARFTAGVPDLDWGM